MRATPTKPVEDIIPDVRREGSVRLVTAGRTFLSVPAEAVAAERIQTGSLLGPEQVGRLERAADREAAYRTAVRLLERRPFARRDLAHRLSLKGHDAESARFALERAERAGYLDDARFATSYVQSRTARGRGPARLRRELLLMGVARPVVEEALQGAGPNPEVQLRKIEQLVAKRLPVLLARGGLNVRRNLMAYLARRGYTGPEVARAVRSAMREDLTAD
jgi:regulatory protein